MHKLRLSFVLVCILFLLVSSSFAQRPGRPTPTPETGSTPAAGAPTPTPAASPGATPVDENQTGGGRGGRGGQGGQFAGGGGGGGPFGGLRFRSIGPAVTSGRVNAFAVDPTDRSKYYVAVASGGVWSR